MKNNNQVNGLINSLKVKYKLPEVKEIDFPIFTTIDGRMNHDVSKQKTLAEVLVISSFPPRECGIATYTQDLLKALNNKFSGSLSYKVCALESGVSDFVYPHDVKHILDTESKDSYEKLAITINSDINIQMVLIQHEFGFYKNQETSFLKMLYDLNKPIVIVFHTVIPQPDELLKSKITSIAALCDSIVVMTNTSALILENDYLISSDKISVIAHGTHLVEHLDEKELKSKYGLSGKSVLTTFGLLSSGKSIETTLKALPEIVTMYPDVVFLIIGKTHPEVVKHEGEVYRGKLEKLVEELHLHDNVRFINKYLCLPELLEYLQLTDIYLFTTNDPNQAVSGTFVYAMSCACPIISTPIPHAKEILTSDMGIIFDFGNHHQLAKSVVSLLKDKPLRKHISNNTLQKIVSSAWENSAVSHAMLMDRIGGGVMKLKYNLPEINLRHMKAMTTEVGIIQFSKINQPDILSGYTLDDNARAMVVACMHYSLKRDDDMLLEITKYLNFIKYCQHTEGDFLNYVDQEGHFTVQNHEVNLEDSNGRAVWALGYLISLESILPYELVLEAKGVIEKTFSMLINIHSTRAMAFVIKGLYYYNQGVPSTQCQEIINVFALRLSRMYAHESNYQWEWFECYLTYANSILPEAMLYAWQVTGNDLFKSIAHESFEFLLSHIFNDNGIEVISNRTWLHKGQELGKYGEQPIDVSYTIMALNKFNDVYDLPFYRDKMETAFNWFLGQNRLHQIVYNPCTGGCYDGIEETHVNLNQGSESTVSYLMARLTVESFKIRTSRDICKRVNP